MNFRFSLFSILFLLAFTIVLPTVYGEKLEVKIPSGAANPEGPAHFLPAEVSIRPGDTIIWGNADTVPHTITSGTLESGVTDMFDSGHMAPGGAFSVFFDEKDIGEITYFCTLHPWMTGIVNVVNLAEGFQIFHNVGSGVFDSTVDMMYKVQRNLVNVDVDTVKNSLTFNFAGKASNDQFEAILPEKLIKDPQSVWIDDVQITHHEFKKTDGFVTLVVTLPDSAQQVKVVGSDVIGAVDPKPSVLINQIFGITDKKFYGQGNEIIISGEIKNPVQLYEITLDVISPKGVTVYHKVIPLVDSTTFTEIVPTSGALREFGEYTVKITGPSAKSLFLSFEYGIVPNEFQSPLKQMRSGVASDDVVCNEGLVLYMKTSDGRAVCLTESTGKILMQRGLMDFF